jgi:hypothetical protein
LTTSIVLFVFVSITCSSRFMRDQVGGTESKLSVLQSFIVISNQTDERNA